jgi:hypothetical protein
VNPSSANVSRTWRGNNDVQLLSELKGSVAYATSCAFYASAQTKPETGALNKRVMRAIGQLDSDSPLKTKLAKLTNAVMGALQVPIQMVIATLLGSSACPIVESSQTVDEYYFPVLSERSTHIDLEALHCSENSDALPVAGASSSKAKLVLAYSDRPTDTSLSPMEYRTKNPNGSDHHFIPWAFVWLGKWLTWLYPTNVELKDQSKRFTFGGVTLGMHKKPIVLSTIPFIVDDPNDERSCWAILKLWWDQGVAVLEVCIDFSSRLTRLVL